MKKLPSYYTDYSAELLSQYNQDRVAKFNQEKKQEARELLAQRIMAYLCVGFFGAITLFAILRANLYD